MISPFSPPLQTFPLVHSLKFVSWKKSFTFLFFFGAHQKSPFFANLFPMGKDHTKHIVAVGSRSKQLRWRIYEVVNSVEEKKRCRIESSQKRESKIVFQSGKSKQDNTTPAEHKVFKAVAIRRLLFDRRKSFRTNKQTNSVGRMLCCWAEAKNPPSLVHIFAFYPYARTSPTYLHYNRRLSTEKKIYRTFSERR